MVHVWVAGETVILCYTWAISECFRDRARFNIPPNTL